MLSIHPSIAKLSKIRKLGWSGGAGYDLSGNLLAKFLDVLPTLKHLFCDGVAEGSKLGRSRLLGTSLSRLQHLNELQFVEGSPLYTSIGLQSYTAPLTSLCLAASSLTADQAHKFIQYFAPTLTTLVLTRLVTDQPLDDTDEHPPYQLPFLTDLTINCWPDSFRECSNLQRLTWEMDGPFIRGWASVSRLASEFTWPHLNAGQPVYQATPSR